MSMGGGPWELGGDATDPDVEWAFFGPHDIEYWVVRDGQLVPADGSELERIAEWERERAARARLLRWEREQAPVRMPSVFVRLVSWCRGLSRRTARVRRAESRVVEGQGDGTPRHWSDVAP